MLSIQKCNVNVNRLKNILLKSKNLKVNSIKPFIVLLSYIIHV